MLIRLARTSWHTDIFMVPSRNLSVVTLGATWGSSLQCRLGHTLPTDPPYNDGYDDAFSASVLWKAVDAATKAVDAATTPSAPSAPSTAENVPIISPAAGREPPTATSGLDEPPHPKGFGSCACACPPGRGNGGCYDLDTPPTGPTDLERCRRYQPLAPRDCPAVGIVRQCHTPPTPGDVDCKAAGEAMRGDVGSPTVWGGLLNCSLRSACVSDPLVGSFVSTASCSCQPVYYGDHACHWSPEPCSRRPTRAKVWARH
jgi:hypothetical protein